jgi:hypothetical protein
MHRMSINGPPSGIAYRWAALVKGWRIVPMVVGLTVLYALLRTMPSYLELPQVRTREFVQASTSVLGSLVAALLVLTTLDEPVDSLPATASRNVKAARTLRMMFLLCVAFLAVSAPAPAGDRLGVAISVAALTGEGLLLSRAAGSSVAWTLPTVHLIAAVTFGATQQGLVSPWAWIIASDVGPAGLLVSTTLLVAGTNLWAAQLDRRIL